MAEQTGFSVVPKYDCPHIADHVLQASSEVGYAYLHRNCTDCKDSSESWICLNCLNIGCSRHVKGHAGDHGAESGHHISVSCSDFSIWCYSCDEYIEDPSLGPYRQALNKAKFPPVAAAPADSYFMCNNCFGRIPGKRFHCAVCADYDLCTDCHNGKVYTEPHTADHLVNEQ